MNQTLHVIALFFFTLDASSACAESLVSGEQIPVGTTDGRGPLATHGVMSFPLGTAHVFNGAQPDLFLATTKYGTKPGLWLYRWIETSESGSPVFQVAQKIGFPFNKPYPPNGTILQTPDGSILAVWIQGKTLVCSVLNTTTWSFEETHRLVIEGIPRAAGSVGVHRNADGTWQVYLGVSDGTRYFTSEVGSRSAEYHPYKGNGIWHGGLPYAALYTAQVSADGRQLLTPAKRISHRDRDVRFAMRHITPVSLSTDNKTQLITGSAMGGLHFFQFNGDDWDERKLAAAPNGIAHRHPSIYATPTAYPNPKTGHTDLIVGGEGGIYFYEFTGKYSESRKPIFAEPIPVQEVEAKLFAGTLPVPNIVDWDGDGTLDIVTGNSEGRILFLKNVGSNDAPAFLPGIPLQASGEIIHVQPGYRLDIQGPGEARWGYTCPTVTDWNSDGLPDILMSDSTARHTVFMNVGTKQRPKLANGRPLYYEGLDMFGTWRVQPAIQKIDGRMAYVALDDEDQFHLYWRVDDYNVVDGGKLRLESGDAIGANFLQGGGSGRLKIILTDWDNDGAVDLVVGTPRHGSVPNPETGLPQSLGLPGSAVLLLKNMCDNAKPAFAFPRILTFRGKPVFLGQHACGPAIAPFRGSKNADLIVAEEEGRFRYFKREDVAFKDIASIESLKISPRKRP